MIYLHLDYTFTYYLILYRWRHIIITKNKFISIIEGTFFTGLFLFSILGLFDIINVDTLIILFFISIANFKSGLYNLSNVVLLLMLYSHSKLFYYQITSYLTIFSIKKQKNRAYHALWKLKYR